MAVTHSPTQWVILTWNTNEIYNRPPQTGGFENGSRWFYLVSFPDDAVVGKGWSMGCTISPVAVGIKNRGVGDLVCMECITISKAAIPLWNIITKKPQYCPYKVVGLRISFRCDLSAALNVCIFFFFIWIFAICWIILCFFKFVYDIVQLKRGLVLYELIVSVLYVINFFIFVEIKI